MVITVGIGFFPAIATFVGNARGVIGRGVEEEPTQFDGTCYSRGSCRKRSVTHLFMMGYGSLILVAHDDHG